MNWKLVIALQRFDLIFRSFLFSLSHFENSFLVRVSRGSTEVIINLENDSHTRRNVNAKKYRTGKGQNRSFFSYEKLHDGQIRLICWFCFVSFFFCFCFLLISFCVVASILSFGEGPNTFGTRWICRCCDHHHSFANKKSNNTNCGWCESKKPRINTFTLDTRPTTPSPCCRPLVNHHQTAFNCIASVCFWNRTKSKVWHAQRLMR